jgi:putative acetyltransferase
MYRFDIPQKHEYPTLLNIWESSVKATHHFLVDGDLQVLKKLIQEKEMFSLADLICIRDSDNLILGFMGVAEDSLEMLFIDSDFRHQGVGKMLLLHAINDLGITRVDVNEQNEQAIGFYEHFGFKVNSRSDLDGQGKPYPLLHMRLCKEPLPQTSVF